MLLYDVNHNTYELSNSLGGGGEGDVFEIEGMATQVAKVFRKIGSDTARKEMQTKIATMIGLSLPCEQDRHVIIAWPKTMLFDKNGLFAGYAMARITNKVPLFCAYLPTERDKVFDKWDLGVAIRLAYNFSSTVACLHKRGVVIGDMNSDNFLVDKNGFITFIDTDSYHIVSANGHVFDTKVGVEDMLPPEMQGKDLSLETSKFSVATDLFGLAIHVFQILMNGCHPFGVPQNVHNSSSSRNPVIKNIATGYCPYIKGATGVINIDAPDFDYLPNYIKELFKRTFAYSASSSIRAETIAKRPTAMEWENSLRKFLHEEMIECRKGHKYPAYFTGGCPWCAIEKRQMPIPTGKARTRFNAQNTCQAQYSGYSNNATAANGSFVNYKRSSGVLYAVNSVVGGLGAMLLSASAVSFSHAIDIIPFSDNTGMVLMAIVGCICGLVIASISAESYRKSEKPYLYLILGLVSPVIALIITCLFIIGISIAIPAIVLIAICSIFANM